jgi:hypothetical protein
MRASCRTVLEIAAGIVLGELVTRKVLIALVALSALWATPAIAQQPVSHQTISVTNVASGGPTIASATLVDSSGTPVSACVVAVEGSQLRYWVDGTTPTSSTGFLVSPGSQIPLPFHAWAANFQAIALTVMGATLQVSCATGTVGPASAASWVVSTPPSLLLFPPACNALLHAAGKC